jgi:NADH-quinone oxidoreductase subunit M
MSVDTLTGSTTLEDLARTIPIISGVFLFVALSSIGLPGLNGFVGEFLVLLGTFFS